MPTILQVLGSPEFIAIMALALLHGSFQLGISVLSLLSGHAFGRKASHTRVLRLGSWYVAGVFGTILALSLSAAYIIASQPINLDILWQAGIAYAVVVGILVLLFYYRLGSRLLWLPKPIAEYLLERTQKTKRGTEAKALGIMTVLAELPFVFAPMLFTILLLQHVAWGIALPVYITYAFVACVPLLVVLGLIGSGHKVSHIQKWREQNKGFLQFVSGVGLIVISIFVFVSNYMEGGLW